MSLLCNKTTRIHIVSHCKYHQFVSRRSVRFHVINTGALLSCVPHYCVFWLIYCRLLHTQSYVMKVLAYQVTHRSFYTQEIALIGSFSDFVAVSARIILQSYLLQTTPTSYDIIKHCWSLTTIPRHYKCIWGAQLPKIIYFSRWQDRFTEVRPRFHCWTFPVRCCCRKKYYTLSRSLEVSCLWIAIIVDAKCTWEMGQVGLPSSNLRRDDTSII